ncbi:MAG: DHHA1 domain-containing protein [Paludibacteraceae bacterium]|nr:DHHA1 domain-containing protein [Paludibacteraceae bacterium]
MEKIWNVKIDGRGMDQLEIIEALLESRGVEDFYEFLNPSSEELIPFEKLNNIDRAADIILDTIDNDGTFLVYYDTDCDGISAGTIMTRYLRNYTDKVITYINEGKQHGVENFPLDNLDGIDTVVIVDSINENAQLYQNMLDRGVRIVIADHHIVPKQLADSDVDICLVSSANDYPNPSLSGSATTWKLCSYIDYLTLNDHADSLVDLACCGLIADMCSVGLDSPENRYICHLGFNNQTNLAIKKINGSYEFNSQAVSFGIAPLINAANRVNDNQTAVELFLSDDTKEVNRLIKALKADKELQNTEVQEKMPELLRQGEAQLDNKCMFFFVETDASVGGLIGNKLLEIYKRPLFVLTSNENGEYCGSMRAIGLTNFAKMVNDTNIGRCLGHESAAGAFIPIDRFAKFKETIENVLKDVEFKQEVDVDIRLDVEQINEDLIRQLKKLNMISGGNFAPITVMVDDIKDFNIGYMSDGKHLKFEAPGLTLIKWNCGEVDIGDGMILSAIGQLDVNWFGRKLTQQMIMNDFKLTQQND